MRILLVEDDPQLGPTLARGLREQAYAVDLATDGNDAVYRVAINDYDIIVLDYMIPEIDGLGVAREIRKRGRNTPILFLTARDAIEDRVAGLDAGADRHIDRPAVPRVRGTPRPTLRCFRARKPTSGCRYPPVGDPDARIPAPHRRCRRDSAHRQETTRCLEFLTARNVWPPSSRLPDITAHVWDDNHDPLSNNLEVFINRVRRRIDDEGGESYIKTRRGSGYLFAPLDGSSTAPRSE